jgi:Phosphodiester glycosidase
VTEVVPRRKLLAAVVAVAALALTVPGLARGESADAPGRWRIRKERIAPGLVLLRIRDPKGPNRIRVLEVDRFSALTLDVQLANDHIPGHEQTSSMAARNGAVAAINGDYTILPSDAGAGRPINLFAEDGTLVTSSLIFGRNFAVSHDEQGVYFGHPKLRALLTRQVSGEQWTIPAWNEAEAMTGQISAYTVAGGPSFPPPLNACSARLIPTGVVAWQDGQAGIGHEHTVQAVRCSFNRLKRRGGTVVAAPQGTIESELITGLVVGETITLSWSPKANWTGVLDTIGGNPILVQKGVVTAGTCTGSYFCDRNPRTGVGINSAGKILLVTVDGRQPGRSVGMTPLEFARLFQSLGATSALNLDGGGSTTMWVEGRIVNRPSGTTERPVGSSLLVLPGPDSEEPVPLPFPPRLAPTVRPRTESVDKGPPRPGAEVPARHPLCSALRDPASTGGMLDAVARGELGVSRDLPRHLERAVEVFRGQRDCVDLLRNRE